MTQENSHFALVNLHFFGVEVEALLPPIHRCPVLVLAPPRHLLHIAPEYKIIQRFTSSSPLSPATGGDSVDPEGFRVVAASRGSDSSSDGSVGDEGSGGGGRDLLVL